MPNLTIRRAKPEDKPEWQRMRLLLWPDEASEADLSDLDRMLAEPTEPVFVAVRENGKLGGFLEGGLRKYADGCDTSPVGYIEGWYVDEDLRKQGVGGDLVRALEGWAREQGRVEVASDTWLDNETSIQAHFALGYEEMERLIHFRKKL
ncbi:MAG: GNAT family N-acetyltransferase [Anaerolineaceae bacterium]|nr:MAG: GNAT family N-acetyltransferase [Anaerolineaceae bacterium]